MILAIDIGNTNIVLGCMEHDRILVEARMATDLLKTSDQYCVELKNLLNLYEVDLQAIEGVIISSVVPPVLNSCRTAVRKLTGKKETLKADLVLLAMGFLKPQHPQYAPNVFLAGDAATGASLVVRCIAGGRKAAADIDQYLQSI